jgi:SagB-type dehydrogenase family enzyme
MITTRSARLTSESGERATARLRLWSLREDVLVESDPGQDPLVVVTRWGETRIEEPGELVRESLRRMSLGPISLENVLPPEDAPGGSTLSRAAGVARLSKVLSELSGSVVHSLGTYDGEGPLLSAIPIARNAEFRLPKVDWRLPLRLSRFTAMRAAAEGMLLESPLAAYQIVLHRLLASRVAAALSTATTISDLSPQLKLAEPVLADIVAYLAATGMVLLGEWDPTGGAKFGEDDDPSLMRWSHHDLLFHSRSRLGRYGGPTGAVFPYADRLPSPPVVKQVPAGRRFPLYRPQLPDLVVGDPPLTEVIENARLCPELAETPVSAEQLGELLYRTARIRSISPASAGADVTYPISDRPYLSVYGLHELELYVSAHRCSGLARGIYHYDPQDHVLTLVNDSQQELDELLDYASIAARTTRRPPLLMTITARVVRSTWMFGGIGYSLTLTHVGALQQTLSLAATAMGLAPCVPAIDPGDVTDSALRLDWPNEIGVGEFIVGHRHEPAAVAHTGL